MRFSEDIGSIAEIALNEAMRTGHFGIGADHLMLAIIRHSDNAACRILTAAGLDLQALKQAIDDAIFRPCGISYEDRDAIHYGESAMSAFNLAALEAMKTGGDTICEEHLLAGIARCAGSVTSSLLKDHGISTAALSAAAMGSRAGVIQETQATAEEIARELEAEIMKTMPLLPKTDKIYS